MVSRLISSIGPETRSGQGHDGWRLIRNHWKPLIGGLLFLSLLPLSTAPSQASVRLISETDTQVIFEVTCQPPTLKPVLLGDDQYWVISSDGLKEGGESSAPAMPVDEVKLALPPGCEAVAELVDADYQFLTDGRPLPVATLIFPDPAESEGAGSDYRSSDQLIPQSVLRPNPEIYHSSQSYPERPVEVLPSCRWRHLRLAPVRINPFVFYPEQDRIGWYSRLRVMVTFVKTSQANESHQVRAVRYPEKQWDAIFKREILNHNRLGRYKRARVARQMAPLKEDSATDLLFRLEVDRTDLYSIAFEQLFNSSPPHQWSDLSLSVAHWANDSFLQHSIVRLHPVDADRDGLFGPGDRFVFYGQTASDCFDLSPGECRYGTVNAYWLAVGQSTGSSMDQIPAWLDEADLAPLESYQTTIHFEENLVYGNGLAFSDSNNHLRGPGAITTDHYNWTFPDPISFGFIQAVPIDLPYIKSVDQIQVHLAGYEAMGSEYMPRLWFSPTDAVELGSLAETDTAWAFPGNPYRIGHYRNQVVTVAPPDGLPPFSALGPGRNYLKIYQPWEGDGLDNAKGAGIGLDWVEIACTCRWRLAQHQLEADLTNEGIVQLLIERVGTKEMVAFDISNPLEPISLNIVDSLFTPNGSTRFDLKLQFDCGAQALPKRLLIAELDYITPLPDGQISLDSSAPLPEFSGQDLVVIYPERFAEALDPLLAHREAAGHRIYSVPTEALYKEYSGGRRHPYAIKRLMRTMWVQSDPPPDYLLLVGDASLDIAGLAGVEQGGEADSTYVPVVTMPGYRNGRELTICDHWFVDNLAGDWDDQMSGNPDLHLGRIPCGNVDELRLYVDKVLAYEQTDLTDPWRSRVVVHSDDSFSSTLSGLSGSTNYRNYRGEQIFADISRESIGRIRETNIFNGITIDSHFHSDWDSIPSLGRCVIDLADTSRCQFDENGEPVLNLTNISYRPSIDYGQDIFKNELIESISEGALIWAYQGHSNRKLLSHEYVFQHANSRSQDVFKLTNSDKPFLFIGAGCHLAAFGHFNEAHPLRGGDAMAEVMLFCCDDDPKGAIAAYASTDFEIIGHKMEEYFFQAMFSVLPEEVNSSQRAVRWRTGDLITAAKSLCISYDRQRFMYSLLGDPALRIGFSSPSITIELNQLPWSTSAGDFASDREDDSLAIAIELEDESAIGFPSITDYFGPVPADSIQVIEEAGARRLKLLYQTEIQRQAYTISIEGEDSEGLPYLTEIPISFEVTFQVLEHDHLYPLCAGDEVDRTDPLAVSIRSSAHLEPEDLTLLADGIPLALQSSLVHQDEGAPFVWDCRYTNLAGFDSGPLTLELEVVQRDGTVLTLGREAIEIREPRLYIKECWWIPSPFDDETTLVYNLSRPADQVRLRIFTVAGACILDIDNTDSHPAVQPSLPIGRGIVSTGAPVWTGRDEDGDPVANGIYFFELTVYDEHRQIADKLIDKLVRFQTR